MYNDSELLLNNTYLRANLKFNKDKLSWFLVNYMQSVVTEKYAIWKKNINFKIKKKNAKTLVSVFELNTIR